MYHHLTAVLCVLTLTGCGDWGRVPKSGAVVASGHGGLSVTTDELIARLAEQPAFVRAGYSTMERKKELLDTAVRFEVLAQEAERLGLDRDPEVISAQRKVMVQKLVQQRMQAASPPITEGELTRYYEAHRAEYQQPKRLRLQALEFDAPAGAPERAQVGARARQALQSGQPFEAVAAAFSEARAAADEPGLQTGEALSERYGPAAAAALLMLSKSEVSEVLETPAGLVIARVLEVQEAGPKPMQLVRAQIENTLQRARRAQAFEAWVASLKDGAAVSIDERALEALQLGATP